MMVRRMRFIIPVLLIAAVSAQGGTVYLSFIQHSPRNLFQTRDGVSDQISAFSPSINQDFSALSFLANLEYSAFRQTTGLSFFSADGGFDCLLPAGKKSAFYFAAGVAGALFPRGDAALRPLGAHQIRE